jgi:beta-glucosidase
LLDKNEQTPAFPFGFGLSYTSFAYSDLRLGQAEMTADGVLAASVDVSNTGRIAGEEVVQLYVGCEGSRVERLVKELKAFRKVRLEPGETTTVIFNVPARRLAYYDEAQARWVVEPAEYHVYVGPSSASQDLLSESFRLRAAP